MRALEQCRWNRVKTAKMLRISYRALLYKIKDSGLDRRAASRPEPVTVLERSSAGPDSLAEARARGRLRLRAPARRPGPGHVGRRRPWCCCPVRRRGSAIIAGPARRVPLDGARAGRPPAGPRGVRAPDGDQRARDAAAHDQPGDPEPRPAGEPDRPVRPLPRSADGTRRRGGHRADAARHRPRAQERRDARAASPPSPSRSATAGSDPRTVAPWSRTRSPPSTSRRT